MGASCTLHVKAANGKDSILYDRLKRNLGNSNLANVIYGYYLAYVKNTTLFDNIGRTDNNGEHLVQDVIKVMDLSKILSEQFSSQALAVTANQLGIRNPLTQQDVIFSDYQDALIKARQINDQNIALVATIKNDKTGYTISLAPRTTVNFSDVLDIEKKVEQQNLLKDFLKKAQLDKLPNSITPGIAPSTVFSLYKWLKDYLKPDNIESVRHINQSQWEVFIEVEKNTNTAVQRLLNYYPQDAVTKVAKLFYNYATKNKKMTTDKRKKQLMNSAIKECLLLNNSTKDNINNIIEKYTQIGSTLVDQLRELITKSNIAYNTIDNVRDGIRAITDVIISMYHSTDTTTTHKDYEEQIIAIMGKYNISIDKTVISQIADILTTYQKSSSLAQKVSDILTSNAIALGIEEAPGDTYGRDEGHTLVQTSSSIPYLSIQASNMQEIVEHALMMLEKWKNMTKQKALYQSKEATNQTIQQINNTLSTAKESYRSQQYVDALQLVLRQLIVPITTFENQKEDFIKKLYDNPDAATINELCTTLNNLRSLLIGLQPLINVTQSLLANNTDEQYSTLKTNLSHLNQQLINNSQLLQESKNMIVRTLFYNILEGERNPYSTFGAINISLHNTSMWEFLYSISESPDQNIALIGQIIRKAQDARLKKVIQYSDRINKATQKLRKAGIYDTKWMYEGVYRTHMVETLDETWEKQSYFDHYRIISDIDWGKYFDAKAQAKAAFIEAYQTKRITYDDLQRRIDEWVINNTDERVVDKESGRTERVPDSQFMKAESPLSSLTLEQKEYYETMMQIKGELGTLIPTFVQDHYKPVQVRKNFKDRIADAHSAGDVWEAIKKKAQDLWVIREDDPLFVQNSATANEKNTIADLEGHRIKEIPIFYINSLKDQHDLMMDFSGGMQAYLGQAVNYECMSQIRETVLFLRNELVGRPELERSPTTNKALNSLYKIENTIKHTGANILLRTPVVKNHITNVLTQQNILDSYIDSLLFGQYFTQSRWLKLIRALTAVTSSLALTFNHTGATANLIVGLAQTAIESVGAQFYNPKDLLWAYSQIFGDGVKEFPTAWMDYFSNDLTTKSGLLKRLFDYEDDSFRKLTTKRFYRAGKVMQEDLMFKLYGIGEEYLHALNLYAILHNIKVQDSQGKIRSLYAAFSTKKNVDGIVELNYDGYKYMNDQGKWVDIDDAFIEKIRKRLRYVNHATHGAMNQEDKGVFSKTLVGILVMNLRQWMVGHYSRRFRSRHYSADLEENVEGYHRTMNKFIWAYFKKWALRRDTYNREMLLGNLTEMEKANLKRALAEDVLFMILLVMQSFNFGMGPMDDVKKDYWKFFWLYQLKRLTMEVQGSTPLLGGVFVQGLSILNSPIAGATTIKNMMYPAYGLINGDITDTVKQGSEKGSNKYLYRLKTNCLPYYKQIQRIEHLNESEQIFRYLQPY